MNNTTTIPLAWQLATLGLLITLIIGLAIWAFKRNEIEHLHIRRTFHDFRNEVHKDLVEIWKKLNGD